MHALEAIQPAKDPGVSTRTVGGESARGGHLSLRVFPRCTSDTNGMAMLNMLGYTTGKNIETTAMSQIVKT